MKNVVVLALCLLLVSLSSEFSMSIPTLSPAKPPEKWPLPTMGSTPSPIPSPHHHGSTGRPARKHHHKIPHAPSSISSQVPDCDGVICSGPLTATPIGSPCGCVLPLKVVVDLGVAPYLLFTHIAEFEVEVATGTFLKQSQIKIMAAVSSVQDPGKTTVTIYLVPLGEKFDNMTALLIYERFWQKRVPIQMTIFGDYEVIDIQYPGFPSSPPSTSDGNAVSGPSAMGSEQFPFTADVPTGKTKKLHFGIIIVVGFSSFTLILACVGIVFFILQWRKLSEPHISLGSAVAPSGTKRSGFRSIMSYSMASSTSASFISTMATCPPSVKTFSLSALEKATDQFNPRNILGKGGFGCVYHGLLEDGSEVAVKLLTKRNQNGEREFIAEIEMLSRLHHRNLVKLIGVCIEGNKRCLIYELIRNGSVESHLHGTDKNEGPLDWDARMKIALGSARGLAYLHEDSNPHVIHRDFKASNVLLEEDFTPKVTDFGLAREASEGDRHISTRVMGTFGYVAPEYAMTGHLLVKSDVYSYGVVLLELLSGRKPVYMSLSGGPENLVTWARPLLSNREGVEQLIDPSLRGNCNMDDVVKVAAIASLCVHTEPSQRPFMGEVVQALKLVYNDTDGVCDDLHSQKELSSSVDYEYRGDFDAENSWWRHRDSPHSDYGRRSPFMTMECSSDPMDEAQRPQSTSQMEAINRHNSSGPLRTKRKKTFYRLRGSISDHEHRSRQGHAGLSL